MSKAKKTPSDDANAPSLEEIMTKVEALIEEMEHPDAPLEATIAMFEDAMKHIKLGQQVLESAEQRVRILMEEDIDDELPEEDA